VAAEVRLYSHLFVDPDPGRLEFTEALDPASLTVRAARVEPAIAQSPAARFQFERQGYFCRDSVDDRPGRPVFNRIVALKEGYR
jgi:glutaminyl-tRNA synthetase